ncbi:MAG: PilZ domain-containing protein [Endomicrobiia bacterium]|nr:PilZ domain-containing protein [Endomicrobiia bacterium]
MFEKRKYPRIKCQLFTELYESESVLGIGEIFDISSTGAGLESHTPFVRGQWASIRFILEGELLILPIEIVRVENRTRRKFFGIKFLPDNPETMEKIKKYVDKFKQ